MNIFMWWIILLIPLCVYLSTQILAGLNLFTLFLIGVTVLIFLAVEVAQVRKDRSRSKMPLSAMGIIALSVVVGTVLSLMR